MLGKLVSSRPWKVVGEGGGGGGGGGGVGRVKGSRVAVGFVSHPDPIPGR